MFDFRKLEAFCKVYEQHSFSKAGDVLFLSQPTISAHVQALEKDVGVKLLARMGRTVLPTPAGTVLYKHGIKAFAELEAAKNEISRLAGSIAGNVTLGASTIPASFLLPDIVVDFVAKYPQVNLKLVVGDSSGIIHAVLEGEIMLGVVGSAEKHADLKFSRLMDDELVIVTVPGLKALQKQKQSYDFSEAAFWPWIMREDGSGTRKAFENGVLQAGFRPRTLNVVLDVDSTQAAVQYALAGMGVTVTSRIVARKSLERGELVELKINGLSFSREFYIVHNTRCDFFPAAAEFAAAVQRGADGIFNNDPE